MAQRDYLQAFMKAELHRVMSDMASGPRILASGACPVWHTAPSWAPRAVTFRGIKEPHVVSMNRTEGRNQTNSCNLENYKHQKTTSKLLGLQSTDPDLLLSENPPPAQIPQFGREDISLPPYI